MTNFELFLIEILDYLVSFDIFEIICKRNYFYEIFKNH